MRSFFEHPYMVWNENRIRIGNMKRTYENIAIPKSKENFVTKELEIPLDQNHFEVLLFMDVYPIKDSLHISTATIFDP